MCFLSTTMSVWMLLFISSVSSSNNQKNIKAKPGDSATLECIAAGGKPISAVEWTRNELGEEFVLLYKDKQIDPFNQHPSYKNRVDLKDRTMKDGDVSMVLKNVTNADNGTYECRVLNKGRLETELISTIQLDVISGDKDRGSEDKGNKDGTIELIVGLIIPVIIVVAAGVLFIIYKNKSACLRKKVPDSPVEL